MLSNYLHVDQLSKKSHHLWDTERFSSMKHVVDLFNTKTFRPQEGLLQLLVTKQIMQDKNKEISNA